MSDEECKCQDYDNEIEDEGTCMACGNPLQLVRPGKHQCDHCETDARTNRVMEQALASERFRATPQWVDASKWLPQGPHEVLATDMEGRFLACLQGSEWWCPILDEPIDSVVTHWMELPELPEE
jgi:hypothetical protein